MKLVTAPADPAFIDFETQSEAELTTVHKYTTHPSTRVLTCVVKVRGKTYRMGPYLTPEDVGLLDRISDEHVLVAHNAPFDAAVWERVLGLPSCEWFDTLPSARAAGFPGKLDELGIIMEGRGKDPNGKRLIELLCKVKNGRVPAPGPAHKLLLDYNERDVDLLETVFNRVKAFGEPALVEVDRTINDRGFHVDRDRLQKLIQLHAYHKSSAEEQFARLAPGVNPRSVPQVLAWLEKRGFKMDSISKFKYKELVEHPENFYIGEEDAEDCFGAVHEVLELRREVVRVGEGKAVAALEALDSDDRIREQLVVYGAHTGRWTGRKFQPHNLPCQAVDVRDLPAEYEAVRLRAEEESREQKRNVQIGEVLNAMMRSVVRGPNKLVADYGAVEGRGTAWVAGEQTMLKMYGDPSTSIYLDMGEKVFKRRLSKENDPQEYTMAKALVLGCGYGMSGAKFELTCKNRGTSTEVFNSAGMTIADAVKTYRTSYPRIPAVWKEYNDAVHAAVNGCSTEAGRCFFCMVGSDLHMQLPSGRVMVYRNARIEPRVPAYAILYNMERVTVPTVVFDFPRMFGTKQKEGFLYGSKVCENAVQAICRDLLADALVKCEQAGLNPCLHVHDEIVCEADVSRLPEFLEIMSTPPAWAAGFPVLVEGYSGPVWSKKVKGYTKLDMMNGRVVSK